MDTSEVGTINNYCQGVLIVQVSLYTKVFTITCSTHLRIIQLIAVSFPTSSAAHVATDPATSDISYNNFNTIN